MLGAKKQYFKMITSLSVEHIPTTQFHYHKCNYVIALDVFIALNFLLPSLYHNTLYIDRAFSSFASFVQGFFKVRHQCDLNVNNLIFSLSMSNIHEQ